MTAGLLGEDQAVTADPDELVCVKCGAGFAYAGRGRKPKTCPDCRERRSAAADSEEAPPQRPKQSRPIEALQRNIEQQLMMLGMGLMMFDPFDGQLIMTRAKAGAQALANLAQTNPHIRKFLETGVEAAGWGPVLMWAVQVTLPIAAHHGLIRGVPDPATFTRPSNGNGNVPL